MLRDLLIRERPRVVIEIGLAYGSSALAIGEALLSVGHPEANHVMIDAYQDRFLNVGCEFVESAGLARIASLVRYRSQLALPQLLADGLVADAAFADGSHMFQNVFVDLYFLREIVRPGGLLVLDDCDWPSVQPRHGISSSTPAGLRIRLEHRRVCARSDCRMSGSNQHSRSSRCSLFDQP